MPSYQGINYQMLRLDDATILQHQLRMGDAHIRPEDVNRVNVELQFGASLEHLKKKGLIR